eukprot:CAMPEP_0202489674 /NCGR_PEP_ID=MMETSP1361-20130828/7342_1 /ASSEMBLY_ACC=CAM_ASM_000849 /TAXON_ID=210615 /ORGANISM="Staurosira complex sp., Strain CCMP2646" /LENGTH=39 /DNA_ID= /DNA_START= /DNA_END= /DNA_ORIENTATION=
MRFTSSLGGVGGDGQALDSAQILNIVVQQTQCHKEHPCS